MFKHNRIYFQIARGINKLLKCLHYCKLQTFSNSEAYLYVGVFFRLSVLNGGYDFCILH